MKDVGFAMVRRDLLASLLCTRFSPPAAAEVAVSSWQLNNGEVSIAAPFDCGAVHLSGEPRLLGSGSSGSVFAMDATGAGVPGRVALKVSWATPGAAAAVRNEMRILEQLNGIDGVDILHASCAYSTRGPDANRVMLVLSPLVESAVERVSELDGAMQQRAVDGLASVLVNMLAARVASADVQLLIAPSTGRILLVDLTEARLLASPEPSFADLALANSFIGEVLASVPDGLYDRFEKQVAAAVKALSMPRDGSTPRQLDRALLQALRDRLDLR